VVGRRVAREEEGADDVGENDGVGLLVVGANDGSLVVGRLVGASEGRADGSGVGLLVVGAYDGS